MPFSLFCIQEFIYPPNSVHKISFHIASFSKQIPIMSVSSSAQCGSIIYHIISKWTECSWSLRPLFHLCGILLYKSFQYRFGSTCLIGESVHQLKERWTKTEARMIMWAERRNSVCDAREWRDRRSLGLIAGRDGLYWVNRFSTYIQKLSVNNRAKRMVLRL